MNISQLLKNSFTASFFYLIPILSFSQSPNLTWESRGPDNYCGRTRAILVDQTNPNHFFAGAIGSRIFESYDAENWSPINSYPGCGVSCIGQLDVPPYSIAVGTNNSWDPVGYDNGIYQSDDLGQTWTLVQNSNSLSFCNDIVNIPNTQKMLAATGSGLMIIENGILSAHPTAPLGSCSSIEISPDAQVLVGQFGPVAKMSADGGTTWTTITGGTGNIASAGQRMEFAIANTPVEGNYVVYASSANSGTLVGVYASLNNGLAGTWHEIAPLGSFASPNLQGTYNHVIQTVPGDPYQLFVGFINLHQYIMQPNSSPPVGTWSQVSNYQIAITSPVYVHKDHHAIEFNAQGTMLIGNDGGVARSFTPNMGTAFESHTIGYVSKELYSVGYSMHGEVVVGTIEQGFQYNDYSNATYHSHIKVTDTVGLSCDISSFNKDWMFISGFSSRVYRSTNGGGNFLTFYSNDMIACGIPGTGSNRTMSRLMETQHDTTSTDTLVHVLATNLSAGDTVMLNSLTPGMQVPYTLPVNMQQGDTIKLPDAVQSWFAVAVNNGSGCDGVWLTREATRINSSQPFWWHIPGISNISDIEFSTDCNHMFVGTSSGDIYRVSGLNTLYANMYDVGYATGNPNTFPQTVTTTQIYTGASGSISGIAIDPYNENHVIFTVTGFGTNQVHRSTNAATTIGTGSFSNIHGSLPSVPFYDAMIDRDYQNSGLIVLGSEFGIWATDDLINWTDVSGVIGCVAVYEVRQNWRGFNEGSYRPGEIYVATFGRGVWASESYLSTPDQPDILKVSASSDLLIYPNPASNMTQVDLMLDEPGDIIVDVLALNGALMHKQTYVNMGTGNHTIDIALNNLSNGVYIVRVQTGMQVMTGRLILMH